MASTLLVVIIFVIDLIAFGLAIAAEQRRSTGTITQDITGAAYCVYDKDIATPLGVGAFLLLLVTQSITMVVTRCLCCGRGLRPGGSRTWAIVLFITCWVFFFIAEVCLLAGSVQNAYHTKYVSAQYYTCKTLRKGVFSAAASFIMLTSAASQFYYSSYSKANDGQAPYARDAGIRMGNI